MSAEMLYAARALQGVFAALLAPAALSLISVTFTDSKERAKAFGVFGAISGGGAAIGLVAGGILTEFFSWHWTLLVNVPIAIVVAVVAWRIVPESREHDAPPLDRAGALLSIGAITALVFTIIEAPEWGWLSASTLAGFAVAAALLTVFVRWELRVAHPMLPVSIFRNLRFSASSVAITSAFFALFGFIFLITQYFQLVRGYGPFEAGLRTLPVAFSIAIASVAAPRIVERLGTTAVVRTGLALLATAFVWIAFRTEVDTSYLEIAVQMVFLGAGMGFTTAPATESIMGSLSADKAGIGSAVNDTTRELGGTLGVAIIGSVFSSVYINALGNGQDDGAFAQLPPEAQDLTRESVGAARSVAAELGPNAALYLEEVNQAFLSGLGVGCLVAAGVAAAGAVFANRFLPARA